MRFSRIRFLDRTRFRASFGVRQVLQHVDVEFPVKRLKTIVPASLRSIGYSPQ